MWWVPRAPPSRGSKKLRNVRDLAPERVTLFPSLPHQAVGQGRPWRNRCRTALKHGASRSSVAMAELVQPDPDALICCTSSPAGHALGGGVWCRCPAATGLLVLSEPQVCSGD